MKAVLRSLRSFLFLRQNKSSSAASSFMQCDQGSLSSCCFSVDPFQDVSVWFWYWEGQNQTQNHPLELMFFFFSCTSTLQPLSKCPAPWGYSVPAPDFISCLHWTSHGSCHPVSPDYKSTFGGALLLSSISPCSLWLHLWTLRYHFVAFTKLAQFSIYVTIK